MVKAENNLELCRYFTESNTRYETGKVRCNYQCKYGNKRGGLCESGGLVSKAQNPNFDSDLKERAYVEGARKEFLEHGKKELIAA